MGVWAQRSRRVPLDHVLSVSCLSCWEQFSTCFEDVFPSFRVAQAWRSTLRYILAHSGGVGACQALGFASLAISGSLTYPPHFPAAECVAPVGCCKAAELTLRSAQGFCSVCQQSLPGLMATNAPLVNHSQMLWESWYVICCILFAVHLHPHQDSCGHTTICWQPSCFRSWADMRAIFFLQARCSHRASFSKTVDCKSSCFGTN